MVPVLFSPSSHSLIYNTYFLVPVNIPKKDSVTELLIDYSFMQFIFMTIKLKTLSF